MPSYRITSCPPPPVPMLELRLTLEEAEALARDFARDRLLSKTTSGVLTAIAVLQDRVKASDQIVEDKT